MEISLARFFFDVQDGSRHVQDATGMELHDEAEAIYEASLILAQIAEDAQAIGSLGVLSVAISNETGACLYEASTSFIHD